MEYSAIASTAAKIGAELIKRDRDHKIIIKEDYVAGTFDETVLGKRVPDYDCEYFSIKDRVLTIKKTVGTPIIDGASLAPDRIGSLDFAIGYVPHDCMYNQLEMMLASQEWRDAGWTYSEIRKLADIVLGNSMQKVSGFFARIYYSCVRAFGGVYKKFVSIIIITVLTAIALAGCGGCAVPPGFTPQDAPNYEVVIAAVTK